MWFKIFIFTLIIFKALTSVACTLCDSARSLQLKQAIFNDDLLKNVSIIILPFLIFIIINLLIYKGGYSKFMSRKKLINTNNE